MPRFRVVLFLASLVSLLRAQQTAPASSAPVHQGEQIIVTGTLEPLPLSETDRSVNTYPIPSRVILFGNFADVLRLDSSVDLQQRAPGLQGDISIRGASYGQTLVLVNGIRTNDAQSAHHNFDIPAPLDAISDVQVLRGSGSTLYGSDAIGGVVNVITRVEPKTELRFRSALGNFGTNAESGFFSLLTGSLDQQFSFERELSTGFMDDREYRNLAGSYGLHLKTRLGNTSVFLSGLDRPFGADQFYGNYNSWERTKTWFSSLQQDLGENTSVSVSYRRHTDLFELLRDDPDYYTNRHSDDTWYAALRRHDALTQTATVFYGAEGVFDRVNSTNLGDHQRSRGAAYASLDLRSLKRFSLSLGAREEVYGSGETVFAPAVSGGFWLNSKMKLRASASRAFRLPNFTDLYYHDPANIGNPNLKPEQAWNYEGGLDTYLSTRTRFSATVFQRRDQNDIDYVRSFPDLPWQAVNFDRLHFTGAELTFQTQLSHSQQIDIQYTAIHGTNALVTGDQSKYLFTYPREEAVASWQILSAKGLLARTRLGVINRVQQDVYPLWDLDLAWAQKRWRPYLQFSNLTNTRYQEIPSVLMPGRTVLGGVEFCFICAR